METLNFELATPPERVGMEAMWWSSALLPRGAPGGLKLYDSLEDARFSLEVHKLLYRCGHYAAAPRSELLQARDHRGAPKWGFYLEEVTPLIDVYTSAEMLRLGRARAMSEYMVWKYLLSRDHTRLPSGGRIACQPPLLEMTSPANWGVAGELVMLLDCGPRTLQGAIVEEGA